MPFSYIPEYKKKVNSKVGSLDYITHKPGKQEEWKIYLFYQIISIYFVKIGGGNIQVVNEKQLWRKEARVDHIKKDYSRRGGDIKVLDQKTNWNTNSKVGSLGKHIMNNYKFDSTQIIALIYNLYQNIKLMLVISLVVETYKFYNSHSRRKAFDLESTRVSCTRRF